MIDLADEAVRQYATCEECVVRFKRLHENAKLPTQGKYGDAGWDLYAPVTLGIPALEPVLVPLGFACQLPHGWELQVRPRSGLSSAGLQVSFGTVDSGYRGELKVVVTFINKQSQYYQIEAGQRIAQAVIKRVPAVRWVESAELDDSQRGHGGFGSTGR